MSQDPNELWGEAVHIVNNYSINRCPAKSVRDAMLEEAQFGRKPSIIQLKAFDCATYGHVPKEQMHKLDDKIRN